MSYYRNQLEDWLKSIDVKADRVLDVGGGINSIKGRTKSWEVKEYKILDNEVEKDKMKVETDIITDLNENIERGQFSLSKFNDLKKNKFDIAFCLEVMEYIWNPIVAFNNLNYLIKKGGILYISFPWNYPLHNPSGFDYLRYSENMIKKLAEKVGFEILELKPRVMTHGEESYKDFFVLEGMRAAKRDGRVFHIGYLCKMRKI